MSERKFIKNISITYLLLAILVSLIAWAAYFEINQSVRAQGQIVSDTRTQVIQAADGGVLEKILVKEGQRVKAGEVLAMLEQDRANANVDEGQAMAASLEASLVRAQAEARGTSPVFPSTLNHFPEVVAEQRALYNQKKRSLDDELMNWREALALAKDELEVNEKLFETGDVGKLDLMRSKRQITDIQGRLDATKNKYLQDARQEVTKLQEELSSQRFKLQERQNVLLHTALTAPVAGIVKSLRINTVGGVLRGGDELMQISPTDVGLLMEVKITPADIGLLKTGLPASVKIDAFDYTIYGTLTGEVEYISADTLIEQSPNGQTITFYLARVQIKDNQTNKKLDLNLLRPGMTGSVDIQTGQRSILKYLLKPLTKAFQGAGSER